MPCRLVVRHGRHSPGADVNQNFIYDVVFVASPRRIILLWGVDADRRLSPILGAVCVIWEFELRSIFIDSLYQLNCSEADLRLLEAIIRIFSLACSVFL